MFSGWNVPDELGGIASKKTLELGENDGGGDNDENDDGHNGN